MGQVAGDVGLGLARAEVAAGRLDRQGQGRAEFAEAPAVELGQGQSQGAEALQLVGEAAGRGVGDDRLAVAQLVEGVAEVVLPGALLELEAQAGDLLLEDAGALDIVGQDGAGLAVGVDGDRAGLAGEPLAEVAAGGEPGERVGAGQQQAVGADGVEELDDAPVLLLDVGPPGGQGGVGVVGGRVGGGRRARDALAVAGRAQDGVGRLGGVGAGRRRGRQQQRAGREFRGQGRLLNGAPASVPGPAPRARLRRPGDGGPMALDSAGPGPVCRTAGQARRARGRERAGEAGRPGTTGGGRGPAGPLR